jgi:RNA polymerase sigma-70 factor, ECF subfamily
MPDGREQSLPSACPSKQPDSDQPQPRGPVAGVEDERIRLWVDAAQAGDRPAMEQLILHFQDRVWRRARYRIGDHDEAWEVTQDVFILCFRKIGQFRGEAQFWTWLARIVDNQVKNRQGWWRRRKRDQTYSLQDMSGGYAEEEQVFDPPDTAPSPRQIVAGREEMGALERAMGLLSPEHNEVLMLRFADGQSYEEIAETLQVSLGTVKSRINRARRELRLRLDELM